MPRRSNLRILAAGGDGTVTWLLKTVRELQLEPPPAVAIMPLGTGNDLALSFGWGNAFLDRWIKPPQVSGRVACTAAYPPALACWLRQFVVLHQQSIAEFWCSAGRVQGGAQVQRLANTGLTFPPAACSPPPMQLYRTLKRFADASVRHLDCWDVSITAPDPSFFEELPYALGIPADEVQHPLRCCLGNVWRFLLLAVP